MSEGAKGIVAITGITGFIGRTVARHLQVSGWQVRGLVRSAAGSAGLPAAGLQLIPGSLENFTSLLALVDGVDAVVHCAGAVRGASFADFAEVNLTGLENLLQILKISSRKVKLIHLSSLAARHPELSFYAESKKKGEELLAGNFNDGSWTILRPPAVYGPGDREMLPVFKLMARGLAPIPGRGRSRFSLLHVEDLAVAVEKLLEAVPEQQIFELHDGKTSGYDWSEIIELAADLRGKPVRRLYIPLALLTPAAWLNQKLGSFTRFRPMLTPGKIREIAYPDWVCDNEKISRVTGWQPAVTLTAGLTDLLNWTKK